jgi:hypothetical protein
MGISSSSDSWSRSASSHANVAAVACRARSSPRSLPPVSVVTPHATRNEPDTIIPTTYWGTDSEKPVPQWPDIYVGRTSAQQPAPPAPPAFAPPAPRRTRRFRSQQSFRLRGRRTTTCGACPPVSNAMARVSLERPCAHAGVSFWYDASSSPHLHELVGHDRQPRGERGHVGDEL